MNRFTTWRIGVFLSVGIATLGHAQTRFEWPQHQTSVATYQLWDQCLGATVRVNDSVSGAGSVLRDTLPFELSGPYRGLDNVVTLVAQRCSADIPLSSVAIGQTLLAQQVLLFAQRDAEILPLYRTRLTTAATDSQKIDVITSTLQLLLTAIPARLALADSLFSDIAPYNDKWVTRDKLELLGDFCRMSDHKRDMTLAQKYCGRFVSIVHAMSDQEAARYGPPLGFAVAGFERIIRRPELEDSLAKSTQAYVSLARAILTKAFRGWGGSYPLGDKADSIEGDFWFPESARQVGYPRPGRVTLVMSAKMSADVSSNDFSGFVNLRRLIEQFPQLDVVAVTGTAENFGTMAPPPPATEAALNYRKVVDFYKVPVVMAVTKSPTWNLSNPDGRRIFDSYEHSARYYQLYNWAIGVETNPMARVCKWGCGGGTTGVLIDSDGLLVDTFALSSSNREIIEQIRILLKRASR